MYKYITIQNGVRLDHVKYCIICTCTVYIHTRTGTSTQKKGETDFEISYLWGHLPVVFFYFWRYFWR